MANEAEVEAYLKRTGEYTQESEEFYEMYKERLKEGYRSWEFVPIEHIAKLSELASQIVKARYLRNKW